MTEVILIETTDKPLVVIQEAASESIALLEGGATGPAGKGVDFQGVAAENLSGHRMVEASPDGKLRYCTGPQTVGMTYHAAVADAPVTIIPGGVIDEPSWTWTPNLPLFLLPGGFISHTPHTAWSREIGLAVTPTRIVINIKQAIILEV